MKPVAPVLTTPLPLRQFIVHGLLGCLLGTAIGLLNAVVLSIAYERVFDYNAIARSMLFGCCGVIAGAIQGAFLRPIVPPRLLWLLLSGIGWAIDGYLGAASTIANPLVSDLFAAGFFYGSIAAIPQLVMVQRPSRFAASWPVLVGGIWVILLAILQWQSKLIYDIAYWIVDLVLK